MLLNEALFSTYASHFVSISDILNDKWMLSVTDDEIRYLTKSVLKSCLIKSDYIDVLWEYHILYSCSYNVPVLYFNACTENGKPIDLEDIWSIGNSLYEHQIKTNKWNTITQNEHPYFRIPFFMIHPCKSELIFKNIVSDKHYVNPIVTWLTTVAPIINLLLPLEYAVDQNAEVLLAIDINEIANKVYKHNFPAVNLRASNIQSLTADEINKLTPDMILLSPPCQPFTRNGVRKDIEDNRSSSFLHIISLFPHLDSVKYILLENVKGFEISEARTCFVSVLKSCNFKFKEFLLNSNQFNVCNSRLRYYLIGKKIPLENKPMTNDDDAIQIVVDDRFDEQIETDFPLEKNDDEEELITVGKFLEFNDWDSNNQYCLPLSLFAKYYSVLDIVGIDSVRTCCFTKAYSRYLHGTGSILSIVDTNDALKIKQQYIGNTNNTVNSTTTHLQRQLKPRFFTPAEVAHLMCFPSEFSFPTEVNDKQKYRLLGNSVNVLVVSKLIHYLLSEF